MLRLRRLFGRLCGARLTCAGSGRRVLSRLTCGASGAVLSRLPRRVGRAVLALPRLSLSRLPLDTGRTVGLPRCADKPILRTMGTDDSRRIERTRSRRRRDGGVAAVGVRG